MSEPVAKELCDERHNMLREDIAEIKTIVLDMKKLILGNGKAGLAGRIATVESDVIRLEKTAEEVKRGVWQIARQLLPWLIIMGLGGEKVAGILGYG